MRTPGGVTDVDEARERLLALATQSSRLTAGFGGVEEATRALHRICDQHADIGSKLAGSLGDQYTLRSADMAAIAESFGGLDEARKATLGISEEIASRNADMAAIAESFGGLDEARKAMLGISEEIAGEKAHWQQTVDNLTRSLNAFRGQMMPDLSFLPMADYSKTLQDAVDSNHALSRRIDDSLDALTDLPDFHNPIHDTNEKLDHMITMQVDLAKLHQNLNETTIAFLSDFRNVAQKTSKQTRVIVDVALLTLVIAGLTLVITGVGVWSNRTSSNDITSANQRMLERLTDRIATIQTNMAAQSSEEREVMLAEQRRLIEQLIYTTQALMEQQAVEQGAAIEQLKNVLERQPGEVKLESK